jgi:hypothetical protein
VRRIVIAALTAVLVLASFVAVRQWRESSASHHCAYSLRSLGLALANYESPTNAIPAQL